jgi:hypothetical protein
LWLIGTASGLADCPPNSFVRAERVQHLLKVVWKRAREFHTPVIGWMFERQAGRMKERPLEM